MAAPQLTQAMVNDILTHWGITAVPAQLTVSFLDRLMHAYCRTVPWESAFRIVRRAQVKNSAACPRWPAQFWQDNLTKGAGGTCFESNYAYFALLQALGFTGYLTVNNMGDSIGCHTAIVIILEGQKWLVDAGFPIYATLPISPHGVMHRASAFLNYTVRPDGPHRYQIEQSPHPNPTAFTLIDEPVTDADYRAHTTADYGADGLFLDRVIMNKIIDDQPWRFNMWEMPWRLNRFERGTRIDVDLIGDPATAVAQHFGLDAPTVIEAFSIVNAGFR